MILNVNILSRNLFDSCSFFLVIFKNAIHELYLRASKLCGVLIKDVTLFIYFYCRFFADILYDFSIFLQILASVYKSAFFILICTSGVFVVSA